MATKTSNALVLDIEKRVHDEYVAHHTRVFWPEQFASDDVGSEDEVLAALNVLAGAGQVVVHADLICPNGDTVWGGFAVDAQRYLSEWHDCPICGIHLEKDEVLAKLHFRPTSKWIQAMDADVPHGARLVKKNG